MTDPTGRASPALDLFGASTRAWFEAQFETPTRVQTEGWPAIASRRNALLLAPTGSGKTLAAFLWCIDRLIRADADEAPGVRVVYVSPLKALVYDVERNLRAPLAGVHEEANARGEALRLPRVAVRTGDTTPRERRAQSKHPAEILVTTPESLYLILGSQQRSTLESVHTVIVDEIHALAPTKRGAHLSLSLERLGALTARDPQRIGLSATARPREEVARFLGGDRPVEIVDATDRPRLDLRIVVPVADMEHPEAAEEITERAARPAPEREGPELRRDYMEPEAGLWPALIPRLLEAIRAHRSTLLFVNSRGLCERLSTPAQRARRRGARARAHHGSVARARSASQMEEALKQRSSSPASSRPARSSSASTWAPSTWCCSSSRPVPSPEACNAWGGQGTGWAR